MGIVNGNGICQALCAKSFLFSVSTTGVPVQHEPKVDANLYIDGPILLYCGNVNAKLNPNTNPQHIINKKLKKIIDVVKSRYNVLETHVFFDGEAPPEKAHRQMQRASRGSNYDIQKIKREFCEYNRFKSIYINDLFKGEAEMEMYRLRNTKTTSIIYTKDTDMFTIAYGHSTPDDVIFCQERIVSAGGSKVYSFFDMRKFCYDAMPREVFYAMMAFAGTDYTETRLSSTQIKCIFENMEQNQPTISLSNIISDDPKKDDISVLVDVIREFLRNHGHGQRSSVCESRKYTLIKESDYLEVVLWYVRYIKYGFNFT